jgi:spermidine/putrescine transport system ATP-binding protein
MMLVRATPVENVSSRTGGRVAGSVDVAVDAISIAYGDTVPVRDLSLNIKAGEFLSLLGPSGCGKTTTLRAIAGFVTPTAGDIRIGGRSVVDVPPNRRSIGMVYQNYALFPHMTVAENVAFGMKMRGFPRSKIAERVRQLLAKLQLSSLGERYPSQMSGGQQQRVALARALAFEPSVLLLDEPLAALDKQLRSDMQFELRKLQREVGITTIFVTHDQEEALSLSDRIAVLNEGKILQVGAPRDVYAFPAHRFVAEFIGEANMLQGVIGQNGGASVLVIEGFPAGCRLFGRYRDGDAVMMVRPEFMRFHQLSNAQGVAGCSVPGRVVNVVYVGTVLKYQIEAGAGRVLRVDVPADSREVPAIGDAVTVSWLPEDARIYRDGILDLP